MSVRDDIVDAFETRFGALGGLPLFGIALRSYKRWIDLYLDATDGEWEQNQARRIEYDLQLVALRLGVDLPMAWCGDCGRPQPELLHEGDTCLACHDRLTHRLLQAEGEASKASQTTVRLFLHGLVSRNVQ